MADGNGKKRILFVTQSLGRGGMERVLVDIANALSDRGYPVTILAYMDNDSLKPELRSNIVYRYVKRREWRLLEKIPYIRWRYKKGFKKYAWETNASAKALYRYYVGKEKYDVEIGFWRGPSIKIVSGSTNKKSKKIAWVHTDFKLCNPKGITMFFHDLEEAKKAYGCYDNIICVSEMAKASFQEVIGHTDKCSVIYNMAPIDLIRQKGIQGIQGKKEKHTIVTLGRLIPDKGFDRLLSATHRLNCEGYDFDVWIIGGGWEENNLKALAEKYQISNVVFWGMQANPYGLLKNADAFICTSLREGFAIVVVEAMAFGLPVISTRCTGPTEILGDGEYGVLVENSEEGVYTGLRKAVSEPDSLIEYRKKSLERCWYFDSNRIIKQIIQLIEGE